MVVGAIPLVLVVMVVLLTEVVEPVAVSHMVPQADLDMELEAMVV
jgi:hypothetical protein